MTADKTVAVVIPFYKVELNDWEAKSLRRALTVFSDRDIVLLLPSKLRAQDVKSLPYEWPEHTSFCYVNDVFLSSVSSYNSFLLTTDFYQLFVDYEYILIYQLDAYVFEDELDEWTALGYDYIGAPIYPEGTPYGESAVQCMGAGGFSLRKVRSFIGNIKQNKRIFYYADLQEIMEPFNIKGKIPKYVHYFICLLKGNLRLISSKNNLEKLGINEDVVFGKYVPKYYLSFKVADYQSSIRFCIDGYPEKDLKLLDGKLPFGLHAWYKNENNLEVWRKFIPDVPNHISTAS